MYIYMNENSKKITENNFYLIAWLYSLPLEAPEAIREVIAVCKYLEMWFLNIGIESNKYDKISQTMPIRIESIV